MKLCDIHTHILPSIDDGPATIQETVEIIKLSRIQNVCNIVATPHKKDVNESGTIGKIQQLITELRSIIVHDGLDINILLGMENHVDDKLPEDIKKGNALSINNSRFILVEMPYTTDLGDSEQNLLNVQKLGYVPIIAHPERMEIFQKDHGLLRKFVGNGMLTQITSGSLIGKFGDDAKTYAESIFTEDIGHVLSSDTHMTAGWRAPDLLQGYELLKGVLGIRKATHIVCTNPLNIINNSAVIKFR